MATKKKITKTTNKILYDTIIMLKKKSTESKRKVFRAVANILSSSASLRAQINLDKIDKHSKKDEYIIIPGKVLGTGDLTKPINIIGFAASNSAIEKIKKSGGNFFEIIDYLKGNCKEKLKILK